MKFLTRVILFSMLFGGEAVAQKKLVHQRIDNILLNLFRNNSGYIDPPVYIFNKNYVVYEDIYSRKILHPNTASFRTLTNWSSLGMAFDRNGVYYQGKLMKMDTTGIKLFKEDRHEGGRIDIIWKTNTKIFKNNVELHGPDPASCEPVDYYGVYCKDKNDVYYLDGNDYKKIPGADPATFRLCNLYGLFGGHGSYDKNYVYYKDTIATYRDERLLPVNDVLVKTSKRVMYLDSRIRQMDAATIRGLSPHISVDKTHIYNDTSVVEVPIPPERFGQLKVWEQANSRIISDGVHVYNIRGNDWPEYDAATFGMIPKSDIWYDKNGVYAYRYGDGKRKTFILKYPFRYTDAVKTSEAHSVWSYLVYDHQVYDPVADTLYENVDDRQLEALKNRWLLTPNQKAPVKQFAFPESSRYRYLVYSSFYVSGGKVFFHGKPLNEIDANTFNLESGIAKDAKHIFYVDDNRNVHYITGVDHDSYRNFAYRLFLDKHNLYDGRQKLISSSKVQLLAIYVGKRFYADEGDGPPQSDYYLLKNSQGYWLIELYGGDPIRYKVPKPLIYYLGPKFNRKWNKAFADFELPKEAEE